MDADDKEALVRYFDKNSEWVGGCLEWTAGKTSDGYGALRTGAKTDRAHRVAFQLHNGPIPDGMVVCHRCDNPPCVNPAHLFLGTVADNNADRDRKGRGAGRFRKGDPTHPSTTRRGTGHWKAKLSNEDVIEIRRLRADGVPQVSVAKRFGVTTDTIRKHERNGAA